MAGCESARRMQSLTLTRCTSRVIGLRAEPRYASHRSTSTLPSFRPARACTHVSMVEVEMSGLGLSRIFFSAASTGGGESNRIGKRVDADLILRQRDARRNTRS